MTESYLDNAATTSVLPAAAQAAMEAMTQCWGNPSSLHGRGIEAHLLLERAREDVAAALGCGKEELTFTSGATESNNLALFGAARAKRRRGRRIVTTAFEHSSVIGAMGQLQKEGFDVVFVPPEPDGTLPPEKIAEQVDKNTILVSTMFVNNELGTILDISRIGRLIKRQNPDVLYHCDAVQAFCKEPFKAARLGVDLLSVSSHKIHGPKGCGALYLKKGVRIEPIVFGGAQERGLRPGTEALPLIAAFAAAAKESSQHMAGSRDHICALNASLRARLSDLDGVFINSPDTASPYILNASVTGVRSEIMLHALEERGVYVSSGSACAKGEPSHVLSALGLSRPLADSALRISFTYESTQAHVDALIDSLRDLIPRYRASRRG
ncbi:cysteine desulfurase family protein [Zongyangia hominis]|uniref:cysteine desulfurase family protein n=1 Tax=Zongyangia hominis TaxID=2763677 RepID=UPI0021CC9545|nr:cysteine desulfurase family protein [Zongyangia hominis]